uniref:Uncharacterized protein n=1 Tax=Caenorhabditis japonica TaxID=281687 RepID=A0A8R1HP61_CAEJA
MLDDNIEIVSKVITFFFPYDAKVEEYEYTDWYPGDPRDFTEGHPHGHETWGHGQKGWWEKDENGWHWYWMDQGDSSGHGSTRLPPIIRTTTRSSSLQQVTLSSLTELPEYSDTLLSVVLGFYALLLIVAFSSNILLANVIKKYRWNSAVVLQVFAIAAWIDHVVSFALLIFVMYLAIFCFKFYWSNKNRSVEWGRSYVLYAVISTWLIAFLVAGFTAFFQCDSHINQLDQCIRIVCAVSNVFSSVFTELLTRVRIVIIIVIILLILLSVRVGSSTHRRESMVKVEGADIHGDRELLLMCCLVFVIYEVSIMIPQLLIYTCISPLISVCAWHFGVLLSTMATPIAVISISRNTRDRALLLYSCSGKGKSAPQGSYAHTAKKYHERAEVTAASKKRRPSGISLFSNEPSGESNNNRKLSMIMEEPVAVKPIGAPESVAIQQYQPIVSHAPPVFSKATKVPKIPNIVRVQSADQVERKTVDYEFSKRRMSHYDMPSMVNSRMKKRLSLGGNTVNMNLPNHIFVHHIHHDNKVRPLELGVSTTISEVE